MGQYIKATVEESFQPELKSGKLEFREINVDLPENKAVAAKFQAAGTALFINAIVDGEDNIQEEAQAWRLLGNQKSFSDYLSKKLRGMIGETVSAGTQKEMEKMNITFYSGDNCPGCVNIQKYLADNSVKDKVAFEWAVSSTAVGLSMGLAGLISGWLASYGFNLVFLFGGFLSLASALILLLAPDLILPSQKASLSKILLKDHRPANIQK